MSNSFFWNLTDDEIQHGLDVMHDTSLQNYDDPMIAFAFDSHLQELAFMLIWCNFDRTLMKLKYANEIDALSKK